MVCQNTCLGDETVSLVSEWLYALEELNEEFLWFQIIQIHKYTMWLLHNKPRTPQPEPKST